MPQFYYIKVGFKGVKLYRRVFVMHSNLGQVGSGVKASEYYDQIKL